jgi:uncharacterized protein YacL (UPF0231 family)
MQIYIAKFEKQEEYSQQHKCDLTKLAISLHPVTSLKGNEASVSSAGVEPTIFLEGKVIEHTHVSQALRDVADMIDKQMDNKTAEELKAELELKPQKG